MVSRGTSPRPEGHRTHQCRGLCQACHFRASRTGVVGLFERITWPNQELRDNWEAYHDMGLSMAEAADRLGVTPGAIERAIHRYRAAQRDSDAV
jgi:hypothetical protein